MEGSLADQLLPQLKVGTDWVEVTILTEPYVLATRRGYTAVMDVMRGKLAHRLFVSAASLSVPLEEIRTSRGALAGARIRLRKRAADAFAPYDVESA
jgi:hypothetical protein